MTLTAFGRCVPSLASLRLGVALMLGLLAVPPGRAEAQECAVPNFDAPIATPVGEDPRGIAVADFDRDGWLDVVTADSLSNTVTVLWGVSSGGFDPAPTVVGTGGGPEAVAVGDFDGNGTTDIVVALQTDQDILPIFKDVAGRTFTPGNILDVDNTPTAVAAGDFDQNGTLDVVVAGLSGDVQFCMNDGTGVFTSGPRPAPGGALTGVAVADFDRKGRLDVAVTRRSPTQDVVLLLAEGAWSVAPFPVAAGAPEDIATGDLDRNGTVDVVVAVQGDDNVSILLGDGGGVLGPANVYNVGGQQVGVDLADFNGDGILDVAVAQEMPQTIAVGLGDGNGKFEDPFSDFTMGEMPQRLATGDFDNDGRPDVVVSAQAGADMAVLFINKFDNPCPNASFARAGRLQVTTGTDNPAAIVRGDWNSDGIPDLAVAGNSGLSVFFGDGTLRFGLPSTYALPITNSPNDRRSLVVADFNLDTRPDLATANPSSGFPNDDSVSVLLNTGGTFAPAIHLPVGPNPWGVAAGDFNGDGAPDLVSADRGGVSVSFLAGRGDGTFDPPVASPTGFGGISSVAAADVDGDLVLDVVLTHTSGSMVRWYRGDGTGAFTPGTGHGVGSQPWSVDVGDLNGDSRPDLAVANVLGDTVSVLLNTGGTFGPATSYPVGDEPGWIRIGRADSDSDLDLVVANRSSDTVTVLLNDGAGAFPTTTEVLGYDRPAAALLVDADRNSRPDLAVANWALAGGVFILPGDGGGGFGPVQVSPASFVGANRSMATGDFDRDGRPDLVTLETQTFNEMSFLKGQGDGTFAPPVTFPTGQSSARGLAVGDFDSNGTLDAVVGGNGSSVSFLAGDGLGGFAPPVVILSASSGSSLFGMAVGDFDRDGKLDFTRVTSLSVTTHYGDGAGAFPVELTTSLVGTSQEALAVLDFNRDGILDLAVSSPATNRVLLLEGRGARLSPPFTRRLPDLVTDSTPEGLAAGDVDRDGVTDLVVSHLFTNPGTLGYFRGLVAAGPPFFDPREDYDLGDVAEVNAEGVRLADVNSDGWLDALVACRGGADEDRPSVRVLAGTGDPTPGLAFGAADVWVVAQENPSQIVVDDFNRDGKPDFATGEVLPGTGNAISVVLNSNCQPRRLRLVQEPSHCNTAGAFFAAQPKVQVEDDGANPLLCNADPVDVVEAGGTPLFGTTPLGTTAGVADWSTAPNPLFMNDPGSGYRLRFTHLFAGQSHSWTYAVSPTLTITGPASYCAASSGFFSTDPGFDTYRWLVNPPFANPLSFTESLTLGAGVLGAGSYVTQVNATVDTCPVGANAPFEVFDDLTSASVAPPAPQSVCTTCTGSNLTVTETGGGAVTRKWGYRATPGGAITYIPSQTGSSYLVDGPDFPGQGTYYVVVETTPQCGVPMMSNEVQVNVEVTATNDVPPVFTVTSTDGNNRLEWAYPPGRTTVRIRYNTDPVWLNCVPPATEADGFADIPDQTAPGNFFDHTPLTNDDTYCYSIFVDTGGGTFPATTRRTVNGRPFDTSGPVKWAYSTGATSMAPPGLGQGVIHVVSNNSILHSVAKGLGGGWPAGWTPFVSTGPSQSRPSTVSISIPPATRAIYLGSQAAGGNNSVAVDADTGLGLWGQPLGAPLQAGPAGIFSAYGGSMDAILLGTFDTTNPNAFHALDPWTGNPLPGWPYNGEPPGNEIGRISSQAAVDYANERAFFTSYHHAAGMDSVWCVELATGTRCPLWPVGATSGLGNIGAGPTLRNGVLYVAPVNGEVHALDANDGSPRWAGPFLTGDGQVKLFVLPDFFSTDLYFSTTNTVWAISDPGGGPPPPPPPGPKWQRSLPSPSQPVYYAGTGRVWVGGGDGNLYILNSSDGLNAVTPLNPIPLGDGNFAVGAPTVDQTGGFVYVGTDAGVVYAVAIP
ncbi:MAG: FG-GAP-like repeat-containing protein [Acidobacteriota bacterium]